MADGAHLAVRSHQRDVVAGVVLGFDGDVLTVVDGTSEAHVHHAARQELLAPGGCERLRGIGEDLDPWHERPGEPELPGNLVVVDLVVGVRGEVARPHGVRGRRCHPRDHGVSPVTTP